MSMIINPKIAKKCRKSAKLEQKQLLEDISQAIKRNLGDIQN